MGEWREGREAQEEGDMCIIMADLHCCMIETNTTLYCNFLPIKKEKKKKLYSSLAPWNSSVKADQYFPLKDE